MPDTRPFVTRKVLARRTGDRGQGLVGDDCWDAGVLGQVPKVEEHVIGEVAGLRAIGEEAVTDRVTVCQRLGTTILALAGGGDAWHEDGYYEWCEGREWRPMHIAEPLEAYNLLKEEKGRKTMEYKRGESI